VPETTPSTPPAAESNNNKPPAPRSSRQTWALACTRLAWIAGVFSLILGGVLIENTFRLYRGPGNGKVRVVEGDELRPLKTALREDPKNEELKAKIRTLDQQLRTDYFRREQLASRGGWILLGSAAIFILTMQLARHLKRPPFATPTLAPRPADPARQSAIAARAVTGTALVLAGLTLAMVSQTNHQWQTLANPAAAPTTVTASGGATGAPAAAGAAAADDPKWFPTAEELAANWPRFRGHDGSGISKLTNLPETWDGPSGKNILWKSPIDLPGENSAVVWGDRVFVTGATDKQRAIYCFDANSGALVWKELVATPQSDKAEAPEVMEDTGFAAPTAVTDGRRVFAIFANGDLAGFSTTGKKLWVRHLGTPENMYGHASSLMMWQNRVIVVYDQAMAEDEKSKLLAFDASTGEPVWSTARPVNNSWVSPILIEVKGKPQIITSADPFVIAYDPATGQEIWRADCMKGDVAPSPVYANDLLYVACDQTSIAAIRPDGTGDVTKTHIAWQQEDAGLPDMSSLLCDGPRLYTLVFGIFYAFDALTGKELWELDLEQKFQSSPCIYNGRIHLLSDKGVMITGEATNEGFKEISRSALGEHIGASPALAPGRLYLRGRTNLYCIGAKDAK
jgi:outer membrane protein assembly factor BamB